MPELSDLHLGASVVSSAGRKVGTLVIVNVEEKGFEPQALVVKEEDSFAGRLLTAESLKALDDAE